MRVRRSQITDLYAKRAAGIPEEAPIRWIANEAKKYPHASDLSQGQPTGYPMPPGLSAMIASAANMTKLKLYSPTRGTEFLRKAVAFDFPYPGEPIDYNQVIVTCGVTEAINTFAGSFINPGDRAIVIGPTYPLYKNAIERFGGIVDWVMMQPDGTLDLDDIRRAFKRKTKALFINTPNNPTGKVFSREELEALAQICIEKNRPVFVDEVYSQMTYGKPHVSMASIPGMDGLTFTSNSISKRFGDPGDRVGWLIAPTIEDAERLVPIHDKSVAATVHRVQLPVGIVLLMARGLPFSKVLSLGSYELEDFENTSHEISLDYYESVNEGCKRRAETLAKALRRCGYEDVGELEGSYYIWPRLPKDPRVPREVKDYKGRALWHLKGPKVAGVPGIVFGPPDPSSDWANRMRFSAGRADDAVELAARNLLEFWRP